MFESQQVAIGDVAHKDAGAKGEKNRDSMNLMKKVLERVMAREKSVITEWCSRNSTQMQTALNAVTHLHEQAANMQKDLQDSHASLAVRFYAPVLRTVHHMCPIHFQQQQHHTLSCQVTKRAKL